MCCADAYRAAWCGDLVQRQMQMGVCVDMAKLRVTGWCQGWDRLTCDDAGDRVDDVPLPGCETARA
jgi:hypothetical protein